VDVKATFQIGRLEECLIEKFPIDQLARQNALRERPSMKISDAHESSADENRDATLPNQLTRLELRERIPVRTVL
jgi:hypothetical protein